MARFQRQRGDGVAARASNLELFYDLVFVFAITQVSHLLLDNLSWEGAGQAAVILLAVWWAWNYTTWVTNELDVEAPAVRGMVLAVMLGSLLLAVAIPEAWGERALLFVGAYVAIQVGRHAFLTFVSGTRGSLERLRAARILTWFCFSGAFWLAGGLVDGGVTRTVLWLIALAIDYSAPLFTYAVPGMRRVHLQDWNVISEHFAERFQLFVIIALGESIAITGATAAGLDLELEQVVAFVIAFIGSAALWWLYFNRAADRFSGHLDDPERRTLVARDIYTYMHAAIVAAIILSAVGDEILLLHPGDPLETSELLVLAGGPALYLASLSLLRLRAAGSLSPKRTAAALACVLVGLASSSAAAIVVAALLTTVLVLLVIAEELSIQRDGRRVRVVHR